MHLATIKNHSAGAIFFKSSAKYDLPYFAGKKMAFFAVIWGFGFASSELKIGSMVALGTTWGQARTPTDKTPRSGRMKPGEVALGSV